MLLRGILLLSGTAFLGECLEFIINLVLAKELGEYGLGQYMSVTPIIGFIMVMASLELTPTISKMVAETERKEQLSIIKAAFQIVSSMMVILTGGLVLFFIRFPGVLPENSYLAWMIILLVPFVSITAVIRGYFVGIGKMGHIALTNLFRRGIQLAILLLVFGMLEIPAQWALFFAVAAAVGGEILVFVYFLSGFRPDWKQLKEISGRSGISARGWRSRMLSASVPMTAMRFFHSLTHAVEPALIKETLVLGGLSAKKATENFGLISGVAMPIGFFPAFIAHSMMTALIPEVSSLAAKGDFCGLRRLLKQILAWTVFYGGVACLFLFIQADFLSHLFVEEKEAPRILRLLWPYFFFHYFIIPLQAFLIGLGGTKDAFYHQIWSTAVTFAALWMIGSNRRFLVDGVIIAMNAGALLLLLLHYFTVRRLVDGSAAWGAVWQGKSLEKKGAAGGLFRR